MWMNVWKCSLSYIVSESLIALVTFLEGKFGCRYQNENVHFLGTSNYTPKNRYSLQKYLNMCPKMYVLGYSTT